ncbi:sulfotransferase family protein [Lacimicrobium alkaliphilum]|uniref:Sulfotransferase family protein n=1 Tax=Lacimicrobium alkaliphilum TaxID=1526571 RepID=A0ABQ1R0E7_9ALTE|nr:sulfotransferase family protein [Lacimicrobium alkaliphilum]GGD50798.1 sulfotransferase family protein [Lacimicrobium alkaliphilum]
MRIIGAGVGRTGTYSLKLAINELGLGPCHHMEEVLHNMDLQVPLWKDALRGEADWSAIYANYNSAVDWPTAGYFRELYDAYPDARFILSHREPESWASSFGSTIYTLLGTRGDATKEMRDWLDMCSGVIEKTGFPSGLEHQQLKDAFIAHNEAVKATIPARQLLVFEVKEGWQPLCNFLELPAPDKPFPRTNHRQEFWDRVSGKI